MTKPDDRAQDAHPDATPADEELDGAALPDDALDENGEDAALYEDEEVAAGAVAVPTTARAGRASATSRGPGRGPRGNRGPAAPARVPTASDIAVHIDDRASAIFVIAAIAIFVLIFLNALVLGKGGLLTPIATAAPVVIAPAASVEPSASASPAASASPGASAPASGSPAPSASPAASPSG
ncbi:MAG TPA: hypothetical protein VIK16_06335 [Candidatus Limnocylindrales bacterium]